MCKQFGSAAGITRAHIAPPHRPTARRFMAPQHHALQRQQQQFSLYLPFQHSQRQQQQQQLSRGPICMAAAVPLAVLAAASGGGGASAAAAVVVGWLVVAGSCFRSVPQILRILKFRR